MDEVYHLKHGQTQPTKREYLYMTLNSINKWGGNSVALGTMEYRFKIIPRKFFLNWIGSTWKNTSMRLTNLCKISGI